MTDKLLCSPARRQQESKMWTDGPSSSHSAEAASHQKNLPVQTPEFLQVGFQLHQGEITDVESGGKGLHSSAKSRLSRGLTEFVSSQILCSI